MLDYTKFLKESADFDVLADECENLLHKIREETEDFEIAMHVMFFDDPPLFELERHVQRKAVLVGELQDRVERLKVYNRMWDIEDEN